MIACGPLVPLDVLDGVPQTMQNWIARGVFFITIGSIAGFGAQKLHARADQSRRMHEDAVRAFVKTIDAKSPYTARHSERVAELSSAIAIELRLGKQFAEHIRWAALLHDVGKLWVPDEIINKRATLTDSEWQVIKEHPVHSAEFVREIVDFRDYYDVVRSHHERFDGAGYPDGLSGEAIPLGGRILAVADAFEAMTSDRPYRYGLKFREALAELELNSGSQFDPFIVKACVRAIQTKPSALHYWRNSREEATHSQVG
jgi:putative nucleotidyltransferase with HDIG domain